MTISLVTNACAGDAARLRIVIPSWQRTFGDRFDELVIVLDTRPPSGRIADLHGPLSPDALEEVREALHALASGDSRIRTDELDDDALGTTARRWFTTGTPLRCQAGTPILAFARAFDAAKEGRVVLRADCDMVFYDAGWLEEAVRQLESEHLDLAEPSHLEERPDPTYAVSTRVLLLDNRQFGSRHLPMRPHRLDALRRLHRWRHRRPPWLALEQMLSIEVEAGRMRHHVMPGELGYSMHIATRADATRPDLPGIVLAFERGEIPPEQVRAGWNFDARAWPSDPVQAEVKP